MRIADDSTGSPLIVNQDYYSLHTGAHHQMHIAQSTHVDANPRPL